MSSRARRHHHLDFERRSRGVRDHEIDAVHAAHVGDFVRVGDDGCRSAGHDRLGETRGNQLAAFDMDVRVDEAGQREKPAAVLAFAQIFAHGGDQAVSESDVGFADAARAHVERAAVFQDFVEPFHRRFYNITSNFPPPRNHAGARSRGVPFPRGSVPAGFRSRGIVGAGTRRGRVLPQILK